MALTNVYTGSNGVLTLADEDTPEGKDAKAVVETYQIQTVGRVSGVEITVQTDLEEFHEIGRGTQLHSIRKYSHQRQDYPRAHKRRLAVPLARPRSPADCRGRALRSTGLSTWSSR